MEKGEPYYDGDAGLGRELVMYKNHTAALRATCGRINKLITRTLPIKDLTYLSLSGAEADLNSCVKETVGRVRVAPMAKSGASVRTR